MAEALVVTGERKLMTEVAAKELLGAQGILVVPTTLARSSSEAVRLAKALGLPVALKIVSPAGMHKSEVGGCNCSWPALRR